MKMGNARDFRNLCGWEEDLGDGCGKRLYQTEDFLSKGILRFLWAAAVNARRRASCTGVVGLEMQCSWNDTYPKKNLRRRWACFPYRTWFLQPTSPDTAALTVELANDLALKIEVRASRAGRAGREAVQALCCWMGGERE